MARKDYIVGSGSQAPKWPIVNGFGKWVQAAVIR
jgi:hypothetical protein